MGKYYTTTLQKGSKGDEVKEWQRFLNTQGYSLGVDGDFGDKTYNATIDYQTKNGLGVDGIVGKNTWSKAGYTYLSPTPTFAPNINTTPTDKPNINTTPTSVPTTNSVPELTPYDTSSYGDTEAGKAALQALQDALKAYNGYKPWDADMFSQADWLKSVNEQLQNYGEFTYDLDGDALYQQAKDKYVQLGKLGMADAIGQASAMTGGYGNSYAQSVGQQAYQNQLDNLNDMVPELYQMALDKYKMGKDDLYNQAGYLMDLYAQEYGDHSAEYQRLLDALGVNSDAYYNGFNAFLGEQSNKNSVIGMQNNDAMSRWQAETDNAWRETEWKETMRQATNNDLWDLAQWEETIRQAINGDLWKEAEWTESIRQWQSQFNESVRQFNEQMALSKASSGGSGGSGGKGTSGGTGSGSGKATYADTLWYATGTYDSSGNPVFRNSEGKTMAFGQGINPYTGTKHSDAKYGTFSNGYQPNNIAGTKLKNSGMSTNITGKEQTIWEANGKYYLWRGDLNRYIEVDVSDLG